MPSRAATPITSITSGRRCRFTPTTASAVARPREQTYEEITGRPHASGTQYSSQPVLFAKCVAGSDQPCHQADLDRGQGLRDRAGDLGGLREALEGGRVDARNLA